jgi:mRNA interferase MazF
MLKHRVVLVPFPFDDLSATKVRHAVCLSNEIGPHQHVILGFITSRIPSVVLPTDLILDPADPDFALTGLRSASTLQVHRLMTAATSLIRRELGGLSLRMQSEVSVRLRSVFGI